MFVYYYLLNYNPFVVRISRIKRRISIIPYFQFSKLQLLFAMSSFCRKSLHQIAMLLCITFWNWINPIKMWNEKICVIDYPGKQIPIFHRRISINFVFAISQLVIPFYSILTNLRSPNSNDLVIRLRVISYCEIISLKSKSKTWPSLGTNYLGK